MEEILSKYNSLDPDAQKLVSDYIDMLSRQTISPKEQNKAYKKRLLSISTWPEEDLKPIAENNSFNQFKAEW